MVDCRLRHQSGNIFFALFGTIALIGILGAGVMSFIKGPLTVSVNLTKTSVAENQMTIAAQAAVMASANGVAGGDCDSDNVIEPVEWRTYTTEPHPVGGGLVPQTLGVKTKDPWGTEYGYCVWNHGVTTTGAGCGANLLAGTNSQTYPVVALVSAGPDRAFTTTCRTYAAADVNSDGDIVDATDLELISEATPNDDDIIYKYSYEDAIGAAGGLWGLKSTDPDTASIGKGIEVTGNASSTGTGTFSGGMLLPDSSLITCDPSTSGVMARSSSGTGIELCDGSSWQAISGDGSGSYETPAIVQNTGWLADGAGVPVTSVNGSFSTLPSAGNTILVFAVFDEIDLDASIVAHPTDTVTDNQGNTYTLVSYGGHPRLYTSVYVFAATDIGAPTGTFTITVDSNGDTGRIKFYGMEISGVSASPIDAIGWGSNVYDTSITATTTGATTQANGIAFAAVAGSTDPLTPSVGWSTVTSNAVGAYPDVMINSQSLTSISTPSITWTAGGSDDMEGVLVTLKASPSGGGGGSGVSLPDQTVNTTCDPASIGLMRYNTTGTSSSTTVSTASGGGGGSYATPAIVQTTTPNECTGSCGTSTRTFSTTPTAGNMIIALVTGVGNGTVCDIGANTTLSDNKGNIYTKAVATNETNGWRSNAGIWYAPVTSTSASFIVTAQNTAGGCSTWFTLQTMEVSGLATTFSLDATSSAISGASNLTTVTTAATSQASEFAVGAYDSAGGYGASVSVSPGWTMVTGSGTGEVYHVYNILSSAGAVSNTWTASDTYSAGAIATFKASSSGGGGGSITYVGSNTAGIGGFATASRTLTVSAPAGFAAGDLLIYAISSDSNAAETYTWPAGFTQIYSPSTFVADGQEWAIAYKIASGSETTLSVTAPDTWGVVGTVLAYRGVDATTPITAQSSQMDASSTSSPWTLTGTSITPTAANSKILFFASADTDWTASGGTTGGTLSYTPPAGYTERVDYQGASGDQKTFGSLIIADKDQATATATGAVTGTLTSSAGGTAVTGSILLALNPSGSATSSSETITSSTYAEVCDGSGWVTVGRNELNDLTDVVTNYTGTATSSTSAKYSMFLGEGVGSSATSAAQYNTALGVGSLYALRSGTDNTAFGTDALASTTTGSNNSAFGHNALKMNVTGSYNSAFGAMALQDNTGSYNTAFGNYSLYSNVAKTGSTALGKNAMMYADSGAVSTATNNTAVGYSALMGSATASANTGTNNTAIGHSSLFGNTTGSSNTAIGYQSLYSNTTGSYNTALGAGALYSSLTGTDNTALGYQSLYNNRASQNTAVGYMSLYSNVGKYQNTAVGHQAMAYSHSSATSTAANNTAVGYKAMLGGSGGSASSNSGTNNTAIGNEAMQGYTTGSQNTAAGYQALFYGTTASSNTAAGSLALVTPRKSSYNTAMGYQALRWLYSGTIGTTNGYSNTAIGYNALRLNTTGAATNTANLNVAVGSNALMSATTTVQSVAVGYNAANSNSTGSVISIGHNATGNTTVNAKTGIAIGVNAGFSHRAATAGIAIGNSALYTSSGTTSASDGNIAIGHQALYTAGAGAYNIGIGHQALYFNTTGANNVAIGYRAGYQSGTGSNNTFIGYNADATASTYTNGTAIGNAAVLTASNRIVLGNNLIAGIYAQVTSITAISDRRHKKDIEGSDLGLSFINALHPVSYRFNNGDDTLRYGFIAQDIEGALPANLKPLVNKNADGLALLTREKNDEKTYRVNVGELFAPLVKAVQELDKKIEAVSTKLGRFMSDAKIQMAALFEDSKQLQQRRIEQDREIAELEANIQGLKLSCVAAKGAKHD